jgi:Alkali metal cation/H+ antiporter Nha1 C terminus.
MNYLQIILENEDGDVIKKYDLPSDKSQSDLVAQGLKYMGMGIFVKVLDKAGGAAEKPGQGEGALVAQRGKKKSLPNEQDEEDDKHIRFTIGGIGKRLTKEDFLNEMKKLDKNQAKALAQQMAQSKANASPSRSAAGKTGSSSAPAATTMPCIQVTPDVDTTKAEGETDAERKRRLAALKGMQNLSEEAHEIETEAERRRREAALGLRPHGAEEDSEDDDTPRLPPSRRSIRFAAAPNKERKDSA